MILNIETKYNIGDIFWVLNHENKAEEVTLTSMWIRVDNGNKAYVTNYVIGGHSYTKDMVDTFARTKEELKNKIFN